jgi:hypothetical protein
MGLMSLVYRMKLTCRLDENLAKRRQRILEELTPENGEHRSVCDAKVWCPKLKCI